MQNPEFSSPFSSPTSSPTAPEQPNQQPDHLPDVTREVERAHVAFAPSRLEVNVTTWFANGETESETVFTGQSNSLKHMPEVLAGLAFHETLGTPRSKVGDLVKQQLVEQPDITAQDVTTARQQLHRILPDHIFKRRTVPLGKISVSTRFPQPEDDNVAAEHIRSHTGQIKTSRQQKMADEAEKLRQFMLTQRERVIQEDPEKLDLSRFDHAKITAYGIDYVLPITSLRDMIAVRMIGASKKADMSGGSFTHPELMARIWTSMPIVEREMFQDIDAYDYIVPEDVVKQSHYLFRSLFLRKDTFALGSRPLTHRVYHGAGQETHRYAETGLDVSMKLMVTPEPLNTDIPPVMGLPAINERPHSTSSMEESEFVVSEEAKEAIRTAIHISSPHMPPGQAIAILDVVMDLDANSHLAEFVPQNEEITKEVIDRLKLCLYGVVHTALGEGFYPAVNSRTIAANSRRRRRSNRTRLTGGALLADSRDENAAPKEAISTSQQ